MLIFLKLGADGTVKSVTTAHIWTGEGRDKADGQTNHQSLSTAGDVLKNAKRVFMLSGRVSLQR
jgi:hypothetical protein